MRIIYLFCAFVGFVCAIASTSIFLRFIYAWFSLSFLVVSCAYFFNQSLVFRKDAQGKIPFYIKLFFTPFLVITHLYNTFLRKHDGVPSIQYVGNNLYIGDKVTSSDLTVIAQKNIKAILDVTAEFESLSWSLLDGKISYLNVPILDHSVPSDDQLRQAVIWITNQQLHGGAVLVNCALGRGRSALVIAAYMLSISKERNISEILRDLKNIRTTINPNTRQRKQLEHFAQSDQATQLPTAWLLANPVSGGGKWGEYKELIYSQLSSHYVLTVRESSEYEPISSLAEEAVSHGPDAIIACGGDGTVSEVAAKTINTEIRLGIVPTGTTNALCHVLMGIQTKLLPVDTACSAIVAGKSKKIDTARCNGRLVLLLVGLGFEQKMIENANRQEKDEYGQFAYLRGLWQAIQRGKELRLSLTLDDQEPLSIETRSLVVANAAPLTTLLAQGNGRPDHLDGLLDVTWLATDEAELGTMTSFFELALSGMLSVSPGDSVNHHHAKKITIVNQNDAHYVIDGEVYQGEALQIEISPKSLWVFC